MTGVTARPRTSLRHTIWVAASVAALVLAGCGSGSDTETPATSQASGTAASAPTSATAPLPEAAQLLEHSAKATGSQHSVHVALAATDVEKIAVESVDADVTNQPQGNGRAVGNASVRLKPGTPFVPIEFLVTEKTMYTKDADGKYTSAGPADKFYDPGVILAPEKGLANVIKNIKEPKVEGRETVDEVAGFKVTGTIDSTVIDPLVPKLGDGVDTMPITVWIAEGDTPTLTQMVITRNPGTVEIKLSAWGKEVTIPNPTG